MLTRLTIENFAIIDRVELEFGSGLIALTGETGAGKSIIVDAVGGLLGNRLSVDVIRTGATSEGAASGANSSGAPTTVRRRETSGQCHATPLRAIALSVSKPV